LFIKNKQSGVGMLESKIEKELRLKVKAIGGKAYKFSSPGNNGLPDRIVLYKGQCYFVETKKTKEKLRPLQEAVKRQFLKLGFDIYKVDSVEKVGEFIDEICTS